MEAGVSVLGEQEVFFLLESSARSAWKSCRHPAGVEELVEEVQRAALVVREVPSGAASILQGGDAAAGWSGGWSSELDSTVEAFAKEWKSTHEEVRPA